MHHKYGGISESHTCKDCVWLKILDAELYTTYPGDRMVVVIRAELKGRGARGNFFWRAL